MKKKLSEQEFISEVTQSQGIIHKVCRTYCDIGDDRKDLFQEMIIQLWKSYHTYRGEAKFSSWMYRVCINVALQSIRKTKKSKVDLPGQLPEPEAEQAKDVYEEEAQILQLAIDKLTKVEKAIVLLYLEEKSNEYVAEIMGITPNYVRVKMNRIKKKLRKIINPVAHGN